MTSEQKLVHCGFAALVMFATVSSTRSAGVQGMKGPKVKEEDIIEVVVGEDRKRTCPSNFSAPPEMFIEGCYAAASREHATVDSMITLRSSGTPVTTTQTAETVIANLIDENDFLRTQNNHLHSELKAKQWMHEQELQKLQERLDKLEQKCCCGAISDTTETASEASLSHVMVTDKDGDSLI